MFLLQVYWGSSPQSTEAKTPSVAGSLVPTSVSGSIQYSQGVTYSCFFQTQYGLEQEPSEANLNIQCSFKAPNFKGKTLLSQTSKNKQTAIN